MDKIDRLYEYDDVLIEPIPSQVTSRGQVVISRPFKLLDGSGFTLKVPVIASPMAGIVGTDLIIALADLGGIGILHRFYNDQDKRWEDIDRLEQSGRPYGVAIGIDTTDGNMIVDAIADSGFKGVKIVCVDTANGYNQALVDYVKELYSVLKNKPVAIMAGNVVDHRGVARLLLAGATLFRIGIGSGQLCTTRNNTGVGYPQLSALVDIQTNLPRQFGLVADGGIKTNGDIVKALAGGADFVMMGSMFAKTYESDNNGTIYGMASKKLQQEFYGDVKSIEGVSKEVVKDYSLEEMIGQIEWNIKSACTYVNATDLYELRKNAKFIVVGNHSIVRK